MKTIVTLFTIILLVSVSNHLLACTCIGQRTVKEELKHADAVFVGTVLSKKIIELTDSTLERKSLIIRAIARYDLLVHDIYKGKIKNDTLTIFTGLGVGDCGVLFENGEKYIIYGMIDTYFGQMNNNFKFPKSKNSFWTHICLRTTKYHQDEISEIEKIKKKRKRKTKKTSNFGN